MSAGRGSILRVSVTLMVLGAALLPSPRSAATNASSAAASAPSGAARRSLAEIFGSLPSVSHVRISPDGNLLAWEDESGPTPHAAIFDLRSKSFRNTYVIEKGMTLRQLIWADDDTLLMTVSSARSGSALTGMRSAEFARTVALDAIPRGQQRVLLMDDRHRQVVTGARLLAWHTDTPRSVVMSTWDYSLDSGWIHSVYSVDTRSGAAKVLEAGNQFTEQWVVDSHGSTLARSDWNPATRDYGVFAKQGLGWREIFQRNDDEVELVGLSERDASLMAIVPGKSGRRELWALPLDGSASRVVLADPDFDVMEVTRDEFTGAATAAVLGGPVRKVHWLDPQAETWNNSIARAFPGRNVEISGHSADAKRFIARVESPSSAPAYYFIDLTSHRADIVGEEYPELANVQLGQVKSISYAARDGTQIPAYLTTPPDSTGKNLPLVVLPHGGPEARDYFAFDWLSQFIALQGYAVLQPQFRGSTGFGEAFRKAGYGQWGHLMQDDVTDGVKALIGQGVADPRRVCIVGASYGGYAALAGAAFTPELYVCAVSINGVSDLPAMLGYENDHAGEKSSAVAYWREHIGSAFDPKVMDASPVRAAEHVQARVLLLDSSDDTVVPPAQSQEMARALQRSGKQVSLVTLPGEDHWLSTTTVRVQTLKQLETFLNSSLAAR